MRYRYLPNFWDNVEVRGPHDCWPWKGNVHNTGYGRWKDGLAHRAAYELHHGEIPAGHTIDHVAARGCVLRHCCNPAHLEAVTRGVNSVRGAGPAGANARKTHCSRGHELSGDNLRIKNGTRQCRTCLRAADRRARQEGRKASFGKVKLGETWLQA